MIFPQLSPEYYSDKHKDILALMEAKYAEAITINMSFWTEADIDHRFYAGDQTCWNQVYGGVPFSNRQQFYFNRIRRIVDTVSGHQRRNRKSIICTPYENGDAETTDQFSKIFFNLEQQENYLETISQAFEGALIGGMNLLQVWMDYREDPISGNIRVSNCSYNSFLCDPFWKRRSLEDCNFIWKRSFLTKREIVSLLPDYQDEVMGLWGNDSGSPQSARFQFMAEQYGFATKHLLTYDEFYYRDYRTQKMLADSQTGETIEWRGDDERLKLFLQTYPSVTVIEQEIPTVRLAIVVQGRVIFDGANPLGIDQYPFVPVLAYYHPEIPYFEWRIQGMVRGLRDSQYLYNRRKIIELDTLESQMNSGFIAKENSLVNPADAHLSGQGRVLWIKEEAQMTDVQQIQSPVIPPTTIELSKILGQEMSEIAGVSEELMGFDNKDTLSGFHAALKQSASVTTLQGLFDGLDQSCKSLGKIFIDLIQANYTPGKIKKILEGQEPAPLFYNKAFGKYHATVEEGLNTTTQKQLNFAQLLNLREIGVQIPEEQLIEASTLQNKPQLIQAIQQQKQQQQQMQQQQMQVQMAEIQARTELAQARAVADRGLGLERVSRVEENHALAREREAAAEKDKDIALLNLVKALKELDTMDISHVEQLLGLSERIKANEAATQANTPTASSQQKSQNPRGTRDGLSQVNPQEVRGTQPLRSA